MRVKNNYLVYQHPKSEQYYFIHCVGEEYLDSKQQQIKDAGLNTRVVTHSKLPKGATAWYNDENHPFEVAQNVY